MAITSTMFPDVVDAYRHFNATNYMLRLFDITYRGTTAQRWEVWSHFVGWQLAITVLELPALYLLYRWIFC